MKDIIKAFTIAFLFSCLFTFVVILIA